MDYLLAAAVVDDVLVILLLDRSRCRFGWRWLAETSPDPCECCSTYGRAGGGLVVLPRVFARWTGRGTDGWCGGTGHCDGVFGWSAEALGGVAIITGSFIADLARRTAGVQDRDPQAVRNVSPVLRPDSLRQRGLQT